MNPLHKKFKIAGLGEVLWDIYGEQKFLGGAPANFAANVHFAGHHGIILSRVGNDVLGIELLQQLHKLGVDDSFIQKDDLKPTGTVRVSVDENGIPSFECNRDVAFDNMELRHEWLELANKLDAVLFGTLAQRGEKSRRTIQAFLKSAVSTL
ncbi:MAG: carbohydrate kinase, partial [Calditrichaeota bacterium]|nr:carbohydrate kinase [Calditrichota bacterium]